MLKNVGNIYKYSYKKCKQEGALFPLPFNFALECAIINVIEYHEGLEVNGSTQVFVSKLTGVFP
jgi:hypothetical protein